MGCLILRENEYGQWNEFVDESPQGNIYSKTWYLDALDIEYSILVVTQKDQIQAGLILAKNEIRTYSNPLLVKYLGILFRNFEGKYNSILSKQINLSQCLIDNIKHKYSFDYFFHPFYNNWLPFYWNGFRQQIYYTYMIDFQNKTLEDISKDFSTELRNRIRNGKERVEIVEDVDFETVYALNEKSFLRQGSKSPFKEKQLYNYFKKLAIKNAIRSFGAKNPSGEVSAISVIVYDSKSSNLILNGTDTRILPKGANDYLLYETLNYSSNLSRYFDFEGSMMESIEKFYRKFGGKLTPYYRICKNNLFNHYKIKMINLYKRMKYGK